jgi:hypothetical protein
MLWAPFSNRSRRRLLRLRKGKVRARTTRLVKTTARIQTIKKMSFMFIGRYILAFPEV